MYIYPYTVRIVQYNATQPKKDLEVLFLRSLFLTDFFKFFLLGVQCSTNSLTIHLFGRRSSTVAAM